MLFQDTDFPAVDLSIFFTKIPSRKFEWKRPFQLSKNPKMFVDGVSRFDVQQGELGDCWLLAAITTITLFEKVFNNIVPQDQSFTYKYAGVFHFRFWQYGRWVDVVIDDRLPTYDGKLVFLHSTQPDEFWSALLEKAYAKLHGSYEALKGGSTCEAMEDCTGGVSEMYELNEAPGNIFKIIVKAFKRTSLMGCSIEPDENIVEAQTKDGLIMGHAYAITSIATIDTNEGKVQLIRMRNPWGDEYEWRGAWSDKAPQWNSVQEREKKRLGLVFGNDGEFWMSFKDFLNRFTRLEICNLGPDSFSADDLHRSKITWQTSIFEGEWVPGVTAGGCRNFLESFWHNPQYRITLKDPDEEDEEDKCSIIVALMQKNRRIQRTKGMDSLTIGFTIYKIKQPTKAPKPLDLNFFKYNTSVARSPTFVNMREVSCRFKLPEGVYCIVPSTYEPNQAGEFLLRVCSENKANLEENDEKIGIGNVDVAKIWKCFSMRITDPLLLVMDTVLQVAQCNLCSLYVRGSLCLKNIKNHNMGRKSLNIYVLLEDCFRIIQYNFYTAVYFTLQLLSHEQTEHDKEVSREFHQKVEDDPNFLFKDFLVTKKLYYQLRIKYPKLPKTMPVEVPKLVDKFKSKSKYKMPIHEIILYIFKLISKPISEEQKTEQVKSFFRKIAGEDMEVDWKELKDILDFSAAKDRKPTTFSKDVCRSMIAMMDIDRSGKLGFDEFRELWSNVCEWKSVFKLYDNGSGFIGAFELRQALNSAGYSLNNHVLNILVHRYSSKNNMMSFDDFMMCAVRLKSMIDTFQKKDPQNASKAVFTVEEWIEMTLYS